MSDDTLIKSWSAAAPNHEKMSSPKRKMSSSECASTSDDETWIQWFCNQRGNGYFCQVNTEFLDSNFNLSGLSDQVPHYQRALNSILDLEQEPDDTNVDIIDQAAEFLYGLVHARFILTEKGMAAMIDKFEAGDFGCCPRVYCENQHRLPIGMSDIPGEHMVKLYCPRCEDIYTPKSTRHHHTDGAYFGTGFPHLLFMNYPHLRTSPPTNKHVARLFGFKMHPSVDQVQRDESDIKQRASISSVENVLKKVSGFY